jgi:hypothetical protein
MVDYVPEPPRTHSADALGPRRLWITQLIVRQARQAEDAVRG